MDHDTAESAAREGYDRMAQIYTDHVSLEMTVPSVVRGALEAFTHQVQAKGSGPVIDAGCGPGHVTAFLFELGLEIFGVDNSPALLDIARSTYPELRFESGQLASLPAETGALQAIVAKHSLIHTPPNLVAATLAEFARVLQPGGSLFVSFFGAEDATTHGTPFDHAVTTAYQLDVETMAGLLRSAGFTEQVRMVQQPQPHERQLPHGIFFATHA